eukprot:scaffold20736_cov31-Prasinocladus_malaysianus.AAC.1
MHHVETNVLPLRTVTAPKFLFATRSLSAVDEKFSKLQELKEEAEQKDQDAETSASAALDMVLYR